MNKADLVADKVSTKQPAALSALGELISFIMDYAKDKGFDDQVVWELERTLKIADDVLRFVTVRQKPATKKTKKRPDRPKPPSDASEADSEDESGSMLEEL